MMTNRKIMIVDDEIHILHVLSHKLKSSGFDVMAYQKSDAALSNLEANRPDLIIVDFQMPHGSGLEFSQHVYHVFDKSIPIIMLTPMGLWLDEAVLQTAGVSCCVRKPFSPRKVVETVTDLLAASCV